MARRVDSAAPFGKVVDVRFRFEPGRCDAWHLHFLAGDVRELLAYKREILSLPWILTQHGKRGDVYKRQNSSCATIFSIPGAGIPGRFCSAR